MKTGADPKQQSSTPSLTELSHAEGARTLVATVHQGSLATLHRNSGHPYASLVELLPLRDGDVVMFLSDLAEHTRNLQADERASILITEPVATDAPLALHRIVLMGRVEQIQQGMNELKQAFSAVHPHAADYIEFSDFSFYRLRVERVRFIGGFGRISWIEEDAYRQAAPPVERTYPHETARLDPPR